MPTAQLHWLMATRGTLTMQLYTSASFALYLPPIQELETQNYLKHLRYTIYIIHSVHKVFTMYTKCTKCKREFHAGESLPGQSIAATTQSPLLPSVCLFVCCISCICCICCICLVAFTFDRMLSQVFTSNMQNMLNAKHPTHATT